MHMEPNSIYVQEITHILYTEALKLFEGDEKLMNLYWGLLTQPSDEEIVLGMKTEVTAFIDEMFYHYFDKKEQ